MRKNGRITMKVSFPSINQAFKKLGVDDRGEVQQMATDEVFRSLPEYMPKKSGRLIGRMTKTHKLIKVTGVQARFLFFGKTRTGLQVQYTRNRNPKAGPNWDRRMMAERERQIAARINKAIRKRR